MQAKQRALSVMLVTAALAGFAWLVLRPHEPYYRGKPVTYWLSRSYDYRSQGVREMPEMADEVLRSLGPNKIPFLLQLAGTRLYGWRFVVGHMARQPEFDYLHLPPQLYKHEVAVWGFRRLGAEGRAAVPALSQLLRHPDVECRATAAYCLAALGPVAAEAVPALVGQLQPIPKADPRQEMAQAAVVHALGAIGPAAQAAIPQLSMLTNESAELALMRIQGKSLGPVLDRLKDTSNTDRWLRTAGLLYRLGTNAEPAVPWLLAALEHTNNRIQTQAIYLLGQLQLRPDLSVPALSALLLSTNDNLRASSLEALRRLGPHAKPALPNIERCCLDRRVWIRQNATNALREIDPAAASRWGIPPIEP